MDHPDDRPVGYLIPMEKRLAFQIPDQEPPVVTNGEGYLI